jgi:hypothetical protein
MPEDFCPVSRGQGLFKGMRSRAGNDREFHAQGTYRSLSNRQKPESVKHFAKPECINYRAPIDLILIVWKPFIGDRICSQWFRELRIRDR